MHKTMGLFMFVVALLVGCQSNPLPTATPTLAKQPIRLISITVDISGLPEQAFATVRVRKDTEPQTLVQAERGNGQWEIGLPLSCDGCIVTASAEGYTSVPISYTLERVNDTFQVYDAARNAQATAVFSFTR